MKNDFCDFIDGWKQPSAEITDFALIARNSDSRAFGLPCHCRALKTPYTPVLEVLAGN